MTSSTNLTLDFLKLLAHDMRWHLLIALADSDRRVQELIDLLHRPQNLVSYHLRLLREGQIVKERRSSADSRDVYYSLDLDHLRTLYQVSGRALHPALAYTDPMVPGNQILDMSVEEDQEEGQRPFRILFLCTHNSARSQLAEGILRNTGRDLVEVFSAGSEPSQVHPLAIRAAATLNIDISRQRSKSIQEFAGQSFDYMITVCDRVREVCPVLPDDPKQIHWSFPDPAEAAGSEEQQYQIFIRTAREISTRIRYLLLMLERRH